MERIQDAVRNFRNVISGKIAEVKSLTNLLDSTGNPIDILVLDSSGSMASDDYEPSRMEGAIAASSRFLEKRFSLNSNSYAGVVTFGTYSSTVAKPVQLNKAGLDYLKSRIDKILPDGGSTSTGNGLMRAQKLIGELSARSSNSRIILLTDGHRNDGPDPVTIAKKIRKAGIQIDVIGIGGTPNDVNEVELRDIASVVSGEIRYWFIDSVSDLIRKFEILAVRRFD